MDVVDKVMPLEVFQRANGRMGVSVSSGAIKRVVDTSEFGNLVAPLIGRILGDQDIHLARNQAWILLLWKHLNM